VDPVTEVRAAPGARISARLPTAAERDAVGAGMWVPMLAVAEPGWPEQLYPADRVVVVVLAEDRGPAADPAPSAAADAERLPPARALFAPDAPTIFQPSASPALSAAGPLAHHPSSSSRASSMPKWWPTSWMTVRRTSSTTCSSVSQIAQIAGR